MSAYIERLQLADFAEEIDKLGELAQDDLCEAASAMFDDMCEVPRGFFDASSGVEEIRTFYGNGTRYLKIDVYLPGSIVEILSTEATVPEYREAGDTLLKATDIVWKDQAAFDVEAIYGFEAIPRDIAQAVTSLAIHVWRTSDPAFAALTETGEAVRMRQIPAIAVEVATKYKQRYSTRFGFA